MYCQHLSVSCSWSLANLISCLVSDCFLHGLCLSRPTQACVLSLSQLYFKARVNIQEWHETTHPEESISRNHARLEWQQRDQPVLRFKLNLGKGKNWQSHLWMGLLTSHLSMRMKIGSMDVSPLQTHFMITHIQFFWRQWNYVIFTQRSQYCCWTDFNVLPLLVYTEPHRAGVKWPWCATLSSIAVLSVRKVSGSWSPVLPH